MAQKTKATQDFLPFTDIRDGIVVMEDGSLRAVLMTSSLNLALKSEDEQAAVLSQFQAFVNSLDFPVQLVVQSRIFDIRPYLALLEAEREKETNELLAIQIREYIRFIQRFTEETNVMEKHFFVVVPYSAPVITTGKNPLGRLFGGAPRTEGADRSFEEQRSQLEQRIGVVSQGLRRTGIRVALLGTEEVVELFYRMFNPGDSEVPTLYRG